MYQVKENELEHDSLEPNVCILSEPLCASGESE